MCCSVQRCFREAQNEKLLYLQVNLLQFTLNCSYIDLIISCCLMRLSLLICTFTEKQLMFVKWHTNNKLSVQKPVRNSTKEYFSNGLVSRQSKQSYVFGTDSTPPTSPRCGNCYKRRFIWFCKSFSQYVGPLQQQICLHKMWQWPPPS